MAIMGTVFERWDAEMRGKSIGKRLTSLMNNESYTDEDRRRLEGIDAKIHGLRHILDAGFFADKPPIDIDDDEEDLLF